jgi:serine/threonine protein kinase
MMIKFFIIQILNGLKFFHLHNIIHGDIKMENILLSNYFVVKISDFSTVLIINKN